MQHSLIWRPEWLEGQSWWLIEGLELASLSAPLLHQLNAFLLWGQILTATTPNLVKRKAPRKAPEFNSNWDQCENMFEFLKSWQIRGRWGRTQAANTKQFVSDPQKVAREQTTKELLVRMIRQQEQVEQEEQEEEKRDPLTLVSRLKAGGAPILITLYLH